MIAALHKLDGRGAVVAAYPAVFFGHLGKARGGLILGTFSGFVSFAVTCSTYLSLAAGTGAELAPAIGAAGMIDFDVFGRDPGAAAFCRAIYTVLSGILLILFIPLHLEFHVKNLVYVLERYAVLSATFWRHVCWIANGHCENALEARMAHAMATR